MLDFKVPEQLWPFILNGCCSRAQFVQMAEEKPATTSPRKHQKPA
jgi:hypothetical protein